MNKQLDFSLEVKGVPDEEGVFEGLASPYGGPADSYGDIIEPGAYASTLNAHFRAGTMPLMLWNHNPDQPIGVWEEFAEQGRGLVGKGRLLRGVRKAEEVYIMLKNRAVRGLSIGYQVVESVPDGKFNRLKAIDLHEVSIVAFPAAKRARVDVVKADCEHYALMRERMLAGEPLTKRELERGLRDAFDFSRAEAEKAVRLCFGEIGRGELGNVPENDALQAIAALRDALKGFA
jgi:HK97 family phage prohead protease